MTGPADVPEPIRKLNHQDLDWVRDAFLDLGRRAAALDELVRSALKNNDAAKFKLNTTEPVTVVLDCDVLVAAVAVAATPRPVPPGIPEDTAGGPG